jgi:hypothetical protein
MISQSYPLSPQQKETLDALITKMDLLNNDKTTDEDVEGWLNNAVETFKEENIYEKVGSSKSVLKSS